MVTRRLGICGLGALLMLVSVACESKSYKSSEAFSTVCMEIFRDASGKNAATFEKRLESAKANADSWPQSLQTAADNVVAALRAQAKANEDADAMVERFKNDHRGNGISPMEKFEEAKVLKASVDKRLESVQPVSAALAEFMRTREALK